MTNEAILEMVNNAISYLDDKDDTYGMTPINIMRQDGIKTAKDMHILSDTTGAWLETLRCAIVEEIEKEAAKKNGKFAIRSAVKKLAKETLKKNKEVRPSIAYAWYDEENGKYFMLNYYWMLISENPDGMELVPDCIKRTNKPFDYRKAVPDKFTMRTIPLPDIGKLTAYIKQSKAEKKKETIAVLHNGVEKLGVNAECLVTMMQITGATEMYYKSPIHAYYLEGNGYEAIIMPKKVEDKEITDFDKI